MGLKDRPTLLPSDHTKKDVTEALIEILAMGDGNNFTLHKYGHWGALACPKGCCAIAVSGTPKNPSGHARKLLREARKCPREDGDAQNKKRD